MAVTVYVDCRTQFDNLGDDLILAELLSFARARGTVVADDRATPEWVSEILGIRPEESTAARGGGFTRRLLAQAVNDRRSRVADEVVLLLKPGHIGGAYTGRVLLRRVGLLALSAGCRLVGVRVVRIGFSVDELSPTLRRIEKLQSKVMAEYLPRDPLSIEYATRVGIRVTGRSTDLAFGMAYSDAPPARYDTALSFRPSMVGRATQDGYADELQLLLASWLDRQAEQGRSTVWCSQVVSDDAFAARVDGDRGTPRVSFNRDSASAAALLDTYSVSSVVLTNRLHTLLFALARGTLAVALTDTASHNKLTGLLKDIGLGDLVIDLHGQTPEGLEARLDELRANRPAILEQAREVFAERREALNALSDRVMCSRTADDTRSLV